MLALSSVVNASMTSSVRAEVTPKRIIEDYRAIVAPRGIARAGAIAIGGIPQWITVRGRDTRNPILLVLHGGPGAPELPTSWAWESPLEDYFTVVQWDQRGTGKTYGLSDPAAVAPTIALPRMEADALELVDYLRRTYHKRKIFVFGHSWGSILGLELAARHPDRLYAYIGAGQFINGAQNERIGYDFTLRAARADRNAKAVAELLAIAPYPNAAGEMPIPSLNVERTWSIYYGELTYGRTSYDYQENAEKLSPAYDAKDFANIDNGSALLLPRLWPAMSHIDFTSVTHLNCPAIVFAGRHDYTTPSQIAATWFAKLRAPAKTFVWFENSAHMIVPEEPGKFFKYLVDDARPFAARVGDVAPL